MKKQILAGILIAATVIVGTAQPTHALLEIARSDNSAAANPDQNGNVSETPAKQPNEEATNPSADAPGQVLDATSEQSRELKRQQIRLRIEQRKNSVGDKLSGRRAELCETKEIRINQILQNRRIAADRHLETFHAIETRLTEFVKAEGLTIDSANAHQTSLVATFENATDYIDIAEQEIFACENTPESQPGVIVMGIMAEVKQAIKDYREAIRLYADAVRTAAVNQSDQTEQSAQTGNETQEIAE